MNSNQQAKDNGFQSELLARQVLENQGFRVEHLNSIFDFFLNERYYIEVKSCQSTIVDNSHFNHLRYGRYTFYKKQHKFLLDHAGVYMFLVHTNNWYSHLFFIKAENITYKKQHTWKYLLEAANNHDTTFKNLLEQTHFMSDYYD